MKGKKATAFAPATIGNFCVGFDVLGLALDTIGDSVTVTLTDHPGIIHVSKIKGSSQIPTDPHKNTATVGLFQFLKDLAPRNGFEVEITKGIPLGSGMGGSASSAVAAVVAANTLLKKPLRKVDLMKYALLGEAVASGGSHGDNVAPCLLGGLTLVQSVDPVEVVSLPFPKEILLVVVHPNIRIDTKESRAILKPAVFLKDYVSQSANLAGFVSGCFTKDIDLMQRCFKDIIIEPQRQSLIPGFSNAKQAAKENGALGFSISGSGPTVFALAKSKRSAYSIKDAIVKAFEDSGVGPADSWVSQVSKKGASLQ